MVWKLNYHHDFRSSWQYRIQRMLLLLGTVIFDRSTTMRFIHDSQNHGKPTAIDSSEAGASAWASVPRMGCHFEAHPTEIYSWTCVDRLIDWRYDIGDTDFNINQQSWYWQPLTAQKLTYFVSLCADMACHIDTLYTNWTCSKTLVVYMVYQMFQTPPGCHSINYNLQSQYSQLPWWQMLVQNFRKSTPVILRPFH